MVFVKNNIYWRKYSFQCGVLNPLFGKKGKLHPAWKAKAIHCNPLCEICRKPTKKHTSKFCRGCYTFRTEEHKKKISKGMIGKNKGKKRSEEQKQIIRKRICRGEQHHWWKGGVTPVHLKLRQSFEYKLWRKAVFERDNYTCVWCSQRGGRLNADHIKPFALYPELRFAIDNGRTLCHECHRKTDTYSRKTK